MEEISKKKARVWRNRTLSPRPGPWSFPELCTNPRMRLHNKSYLSLRYIFRCCLLFYRQSR